MFKRLVASLVCLTFIFSNLQQSYAQDFSINQLPIPGTMVGISAPFAPLTLKGLVVNPNKPLEFQFIVDTGEQLRVSVNTTKGPQDTASIKDQANQLVKYFLAGLTIPEGDLWVNLSPYEKNRMVPEALGQTDLGRDLLAQDYILKQLTASLIYPEKDLGKEFWSRVYAKAQQQFGTTNVPVNTFNKVWILPDQAQVFENVNAAYVTKATLKVMLDEDYLSLHKHGVIASAAKQSLITHTLASQIVRQIILPEIEKEVNTGKNFAPLRQIYQALILAKWYKETIQNGLLDALYTNKNKTAGVNLNDPSVKEQIYERYLKAYKKGAFNYIKEDPTPDGQVVPRKYFSGGTFFGNIQETRDYNPADVYADGNNAMITVALVAAGAVAAIAGGYGLLKRPKDKKDNLRNQSSDSLEGLGQGPTSSDAYTSWDSQGNGVGPTPGDNSDPAMFTPEAPKQDAAMLTWSDYFQKGDREALGRFDLALEELMKGDPFDIYESPDLFSNLYAFMHTGSEEHRQKLIQILDRLENKLDMPHVQVRVYSYLKTFFKIGSKMDRDNLLAELRVAARHINTKEKSSRFYSSIHDFIKSCPEDLSDAAMNADELAHKMEEAEQGANFEEYNRLSNELHQLGDPRGEYVLVPTGETVWDYKMKTAWDAFGAPSEGDKNIPAPYAWEKVKRSDAAMLLARIQLKWILFHNKDYFLYQELLKFLRSAKDNNVFFMTVDALSKELEKISFQSRRQGSLDLLINVDSIGKEATDLILARLRGSNYLNPDVRQEALKSLQKFRIDPDVAEEKIRTEEDRLDAIAKESENLAKELSEAESQEDPDRYNSASDKLNEIGDPRGDYYYQRLPGQWDQSTPQYWDENPGFRDYIKRKRDSAMSAPTKQTLDAAMFNVSYLQRPLNLKMSPDAAMESEAVNFIKRHPGLTVGMTKDEIDAAMNVKKALGNTLGLFGIGTIFLGIGIFVAGVYKGGYPQDTPFWYPISGDPIASGIVFMLVGMMIGVTGIVLINNSDHAMNTAGQNPSGEANANLGPIRERIKNDFNEGRIKKGTIIEITLKEGEPFQIKFSHFDNDLYPMFIYQLKEPGSQRAHDLLEIFEIRDYRVIAANPAGASAAMITLPGTVKWYIKRLNSKDGMTVISAADNLGANGGSEALAALESKLKETSTTLISSLTVDQEGKRYDSPVYKRIKQAIALIKIRLDLKKQRGSIITDRVVNRIEYGAMQDNGGHDDSWKEAHYYNSSGVLILSETLWAQAIDHPTYDVGDTIPDHAMLKTPVHQDKASAAEKGGIDLNQINVLRKGRTVNVHFDPAQLNELEQGGFEGFTPEITGFQYIKSPFPLLGINTPKKTMQLAKA